MPSMSEIKSENSFHNVENWYKEAKENVMEKVVFVLIGSKVDLDSEREVTYEEGLEMMNKLNMDLFFETSAKNDVDIV